MIILYILSFNYSYSCQINIHGKKYGIRRFGKPLVNFRKRGNTTDFFKNLHFKYQQFLWKYQILPTLILTALVSLRSKRAPGQNGAFCNCFSSCKPAQTLNFKFEMFIFHSKYFVYRKLKSALQKLSFCFKWPDTDTCRILGNIP